MHKIDAPHATVDKEFTNGDPALGVPATELIAKWFNSVQRELVAMVEAFGGTLNDADDGQIAAMLESHFDLAEAHGATNAATAYRIALRDGMGRIRAGAGLSSDDVMTMGQFPFSPAGRYMIAPNGFYLTWGPVTTGAESAWTTHSFPITFPHACVGIVVTPYDSASTLDPIVCAQPVTTSTWRSFNEGYPSRSMTFLAWGY